MKLRHFTPLCALLSLCTVAAAQQQPIEVKIDVDVSNTEGALEPVWRFWGADEPNYATMKHGKKLLGELGEMTPDQVFFRAHNLMTTGDGTPRLKWGSTNMYTEDAGGNPVYDWNIVDGIFDAYLENGVRPYVQMGFMPEAMTTHDGPYEHQWGVGDEYGDIYTGWAYPPKDYEKWEELCFQWAKHCAERYGMDEVETWWWQTWNEPNIGYWQGTPEEYMKLHHHAVNGVLRAIPKARIGGADTAGFGGDYTRKFIEYSLENDLPLDFVSFHAKGRPERIDCGHCEGGHVRMGMQHQLRDIDRGFELVASYPETKDKPIVIGESDPEGCAACQGPELAYRNGLMYASYTAASFKRKHDLAAKYDVNFTGALTWAFEFEDEPMFAGFRAMATGGIDKPVLNVFRMMSQMTGNRVELTSDHEIALDKLLADGVREQPDITGIASAGDGKVTVMLWHYHDDDIEGLDANITLNLSGLTLKPGGLTVTHYRVDRDHSNAYTLWQEMGSPEKLSDEQYEQLDARDGLEELGAPFVIDQDNDVATLQVTLPRQAVSLLVIE